MKTGKGWKIYFNALLDDKKFNNETLKEIAEMLSFFIKRKEFCMKKLEQIRQKSKELEI